MLKGKQIEFRDNKKEMLCTIKSWQKRKMKMKKMLCTTKSNDEQYPNGRWAKPYKNDNAAHPRQSKRIKEQNRKRYPYPHALCKEAGEAHLKLYIQEWKYQRKNGYTDDDFHSFYFERHDCKNKGKRHTCPRRRDKKFWKLSYPTTVQLAYIYEPPWMVVDPVFDLDVYYGIT